jgi:hypothetical protein
MLPPDLGRWTAAPGRLTMLVTMPRELVDLAQEVDRLVDEYRSRCLWFLRPDYYPSNDDDRLRVLDYIERYGDRAAFQRAAEVRQWLSQNSSARSASS